MEIVSYIYKKLRHFLKQLFHLLSVSKDDTTSFIRPKNPCIDSFGEINGRNPEEPLLDDEVTSLLQYYQQGKVDSIWEESPQTVDKRDENTPDDWIRRHHSLIRLTGRHPFNCEAPLTSLFDKGFITPTSLHYVRNHGSVPRATWKSHRIYVGGLSPIPLQLSMSQLINMKRRSLPVTLVCCGNRRKEQNMIKQTIGFNWGAAGVSTGIWTGVPLADILELAGISPTNPDFNYQPGRYHVRFASEPDKGGDKLPPGIYGTSVPLEKAWDKSQDIIISFAYNGALLSPDHGFPVRVIIPGYIGGRMIKWLTNIDLLDDQSQDYYHFYDNRVLPSHVDAETAKAEDWWHRPEYIVNDLSVNSAMSCPAHEERLIITPSTKNNTYVLQGYAYCGGGRRVTRVEVSFNSGAVWELATLRVIERPTPHGKYWSWIFWKHEVPQHVFISSSEIVLRAWDESHNSQPDRPTWNVMGMLNNPWFRIKINRVDSYLSNEQQAAGCMSVLFEHPTLAGNQPGGWMSRIKGHASLTAPGAAHPDLPHFDADMLTEECVEIDLQIEKKSETSKQVLMSEVCKHNNQSSAWIVVKGRVYDCTPFLKTHPGNAVSILLEAGKECTEEFAAIHSKKAWKMLEDYYIGDVVDDCVGNADEDSSRTTNDEEPDEFTVIDTSSGRLIALDPTKKISFTLIKKDFLSRDSILFRFALQSPHHTLGLPVGQHMLFTARINGKLCIRAYTPISSDYDLGYFELLIKVYNPSPTFPEGGLMSQYFGRMTLGDKITVQGPIGHVIYEGRGRLLVHDNPHTVKSFAMLCAGTGITPIYQVLCAILRDTADKTVCHVVFANRTEDDILLRTQLDDWSRDHPDRLKLVYVLSQPLHPLEWSNATVAQSSPGREVGRVDGVMLRRHLPVATSESFVVMCGPEGFQEGCATHLREMGYTQEQIVVF